MLYANKGSNVVMEYYELIIVESIKLDKTSSFLTKYLFIALFFFFLFLFPIFITVVQEFITSICC